MATAWATLGLALIALLIFTTVRHLALARRRLGWSVNLSSSPSSSSASADAAFARHPSPYMFIVLGSGGHTREMLAMLESGFSSKFRNLHRRYLVSAGDAVSAERARMMEEELGCGPAAGTWDLRVVPRARRVHQSLLTAPVSALASLLAIFPLLLAAPPPPLPLPVSGPDPGGQPWPRTRPRSSPCPDVILTNGPGTGFIVAIAAYLLKLFFLAPESSMQLVYVESWARIHTLSLTGKLFYYTGIADVFLAQHRPVAAKYGIADAGWLVMRGGEGRAGPAAAEGKKKEEAQPRHVPTVNLN